MAMRALQAAILVLGLASAGVAPACSCVRIAPDEAFYDALFSGADAIVHAKIVHLVTKYEARIEIIESFKGRPTVLKALRSDEGTCGVKFQIGDEAVFALHQGQVSVCSRMPVTRELIEGLRAYKRALQLKRTPAGNAEESRAPVATKP